jgi:SAM-dependent methyltransferase
LLTDEKSGYWDTVAETWQSVQPQTLWRVHSDAVNTALVTRWLPAGRAGRLLKTDMFDESVSGGLYSPLAARTRSVFGIDLSHCTAQAARTHHGMQAINADVRVLPFADNAFDVVVSMSTLDHFKTPHEIVASLRELKRVLRRDGLLLLTLDNLANPMVALRSVLPFELLHRLGVLPYYVGATFGPRRLRSVIAELDFEVIEVNSILHCPRIFAVVVANIVRKYAAGQKQNDFLSFLSGFEQLSKLPTRFLTGYFTAIKAVKR